MPPKTLRKNRPDCILTSAGEDVRRGTLVRQRGITGTERCPVMVPAEETWVGPLYIANETKRGGAKLFVARYGEYLCAEVAGLDAAITAAADQATKDYMKSRKPPKDPEILQVELARVAADAIEGFDIDGMVVYLGPKGSLSMVGTRPVGTLAGHPDKGPIASLEPGACLAVSTLAQVESVLEGVLSRLGALEAESLSATGGGTSKPRTRVRKRTKKAETEE